MTVVAAAVVAAVVVVVVSAMSTPGTPPPGGARGGAASRTAHRGSGGTRPAGRSPGAGARTFHGPYGVESSAMVAENRRPGTTAWKISGTPATGYVQGFAGRTYASVGQKIPLYVSTTGASFQVVAYRMGYYGGDGARAVWRSGQVPGRVQPTCPLTPGVNMVSCDNWTASLTVEVTQAFVQGEYLLKLTGAAGQQSYIPLTVWDPSSHAAYLVMTRSLTEEGWNTYGGYSYYQGQGPCTLGQTGSYPPCNRARVVSFDRPYSIGDGASDFLSNEYPLVRFMEQHGLDAAYCTDVTVDEHPTVLLDHRALLSLGHDETWTYPERAAAQTAMAHGVNLVFFGAAPLVRHSRLQPSSLGADREEVDYRSSAEDPLAATGPTTTVTGNTFATPPVSDPVTTLVGTEYSGYLTTGVAPLPLVVHQPTAWIFKGTGLGAGATVPAVIDSDINHVNPAAAPPDLEVLAHSPVPLSEAYTNQGRWGADTYSDMTYYTDPTSGGGVFASGTVNWIFALNSCAPGGTTCTNAPLATITGNLLSLFGEGAAGKSQPSVANWQSVTPPGS